MTVSPDIVLRLDSVSVTATAPVPAVVVAAPSVTAPSNNATNIGYTPTITSSAFALTSGTDTHANSDWQVASDSGFTSIIAQSLADATNKTSWVVSSALAASTLFYVRVRHRSATGSVSAWSSVIQFTTAAAVDSEVAAVRALSPSLLLWRKKSPGTVNRDGTGALATGTDLVGRIMDLSGNNNHAVARSDGQRAQLSATGWVFSDDFYDLLNSISVANGFTAVMAFKRASAGINSTPIGGVAQQAPLVWDTSNTVYTALPNVTSMTNTNATGSQVITIEHTFPNVKVRRNGSQIASTNIGTASGALSVVGGYFLNSAPHQGELNFIALFPGNLSGANLTAVEAYATASLT